MALTFAKKGHAVVVNYHKNESDAQETEAKIKEVGVPYKIIKADVRHSKDVDAMVKMIQVDWGRVDVLINNAGFIRDKKIVNMSNEEWQDVVDVHLNGNFYCTRSVLPIMLEAKQGSILNIISYLGFKGAIGAANYAAAKAGVLALTKSVAQEVGPSRIRVNAVLPGFHVTDSNKKVWKRFESKIRESHLLPDLPNREELGEFVYAISQLKTVTGQTFPFESRLL